MSTVLVVGFGAFLDVKDNPAAKLAREVDGRGGAELTIVGREMPVSYARAPELTATWTREIGAGFVLGIGVAQSRKMAMIERFGRRRADAKLADVDGVRLAELSTSGSESRESAWAGRVAAALGVEVSSDAGGYVCNAWLYRALERGLPAAFLHVPPSGFPAERIVAALRALSSSPTS